MKFILGKKLEMTQIFDEEGNSIPVTTLVVAPNVITQVKTKDQDGYNAVQVGFDKPKRLKKPQAGHLKGLPAVRTMIEFRLEADEMQNLKRGDAIDIETFVKGDAVNVIGTSKGRGFQGVVKRHGFHGHPASHGHKDQERMPGSIGAGGVQRVFKGVRMAGHMGDDRVTVKGLKIVDINVAKNILYIKGALPGSRNSLVQVVGQGEIKIKASAPQTAPAAATEPVVAKTEDKAISQ